jgi:hypothetical protein
MPTTGHLNTRTCRWGGRAATAGIFLLWWILVVVGWTADMGQSGDGGQALPDMGPRGQAVLDQLLATVTELDYCEHDCAEFAFWIAARPGMLLCEFCYQVAQVLAGDIECAACGRPAGDRGRDAVVVARVTAGLGAHFYLCSWCAELDLRHTGHRG